MVDLTPIKTTVVMGDLVPSFVPDWWNKFWVYRREVDVTAPNSPIAKDSVIEIDLPRSTYTSGRVRKDLADVQVVKHVKGAGTPVLTSAELMDEALKVSYNTQALEEATPSKYYVYYGNISGTGIDAATPHVENLYNNSLTFDGRYVSFTNPGVDWVIRDDGSVLGSKPKSKVHISLGAERVKIRGNKSTQSGKLNVYLNDSFLEEVDLYGAIPSSDEVLFTHVAATPNIFEFKLEIAEVKNVASRGNDIDLTSIEFDGYYSLDVGEEESYPLLTWTSKPGAK